MSTMTANYTNHALVGPKLSTWSVPVGRFLFSLIFILSGFNHFSPSVVGYATSAGVPMANILVPFSGVMAIVGGLSILTGFHARLGAMLILLFLIPVTFTMHNFWASATPQESQMQMAHFMKNLSLMGGALLIAFYGSGPVSLDQRQIKNYREVG